MVDRAYLLEKSTPPSALKQYFDQATIPAAIDALGALESAAERLGNAARRAPLTALALALSSGVALAVAVRYGRRQS